MPNENSNKSAMRKIIKFSVVLIIVFLLLCGIIVVAQSSLMFFPTHDEESRLYLENLPDFTEVSFTAENGKTFHGVFFQANDERSPLVIYFGGNAEVSFRHMRVREIRNDWEYFPGHHYLFIDYEGYGLNEGRPHYRNILEQALAVFDFAVTLPNVDYERIIVKGYSLGTGPAIYLAAHRPVVGVILATPYASGYDLFNNVIPIFHGPIRVLVRQKFPSYRYAPNVTAPILVVASRSDEIIPFASTNRLVDLFSGDVEFMTLENVSHNDIFLVDDVFEAIRTFLEQIAP